jgi:hypothetical protein
MAKCRYCKNDSKTKRLYYIIESAVYMLQQNEGYYKNYSAEMWKE